MYSLHICFLSFPYNFLFLFPNLTKYLPLQDVVVNCVKLATHKKHMYELIILFK